MNHLRKVFYLLVFLYAPLNNATETITLNTLQMDRIAYNKKAIISSMKNNAYIRLALIAASGSLAIGVTKWYLDSVQAEKAALQDQEAAKKKLWNEGFIKYLDIIQARAAATGQEAPSVEDFIENSNTIARNNFNTIQALGGLTPSPKTSLLTDWYRGMKSFASVVWQQAWIGFFSTNLLTLSNLAAKPLDQMVKKIYHDGNLHWFLMYKTNIKNVFGELEAVADDIVLSHDDEERNAALQSFILAHNLLLIEIERMIAFMDYKYDRIKKEYPFAAAGMKLMIHNVINEANRFVNSVQSTLTDTNRHIEIPLLVKNFHKKLHGCRRGFVVYEEYPDQAFAADI